MRDRVDQIRREAEHAGIPGRDVRTRYGVGRSSRSDEVAVAVGKTRPTTVWGVSAADAVAAAVALAMPTGDPYAVKATEQACARMTSRMDRMRARIPAIGAEFTVP
ncbi:hypothetical protein [Streptomyces nodosus]|uniref:Uncharacterized protein n=1 Tax=Streptomyces nodosus TaxID=40318 RepID=A0A0B5DDW5_9ACTN|nr:hypothetical protein [Streptomyces nodosus]AJE41414.1 hypothetical protein SNOD_16255 [Streptomyces nodosus]MBB4792592.1 hypothetical protein [Streptomyces nodosus]QEV39952.1 hypothetical protein CP978_16555 [Streptomyces nodosus]